MNFDMTDTEIDAVLARFKMKTVRVGTKFYLRFHSTFVDYTVVEVKTDRKVVVKRDDDGDLVFAISLRKDGTWFRVGENPGAWDKTFVMY